MQNYRVHVTAIHVVDVVHALLTGKTAHTTVCVRATLQASTVNMVRNTLTDQNIFLKRNSLKMCPNFKMRYSFGYDSMHWNM